VADLTIFHSPEGPVSQEHVHLWPSSQEHSPRPYRTREEIGRNLTPEDIATQRPLFLNRTNDDCDRCGRLHLYIDDLCTEEIDVFDRQCPSINPDEREWREGTKIVLKLNRGVKPSVRGQDHFDAGRPAVESLEHIPEFIIYASPRPCTRCQFEHKYSSELCTRITNYNGDTCPILTSQTIKQRWNTKYELNLITRSDIPEEFQLKPTPTCPKCDGLIDPTRVHTCKLDRKFFDEALNKQAQAIQERKQAVHEQRIAFGLAHPSDIHRPEDGPAPLIPGPAPLIPGPALPIPVAPLQQGLSKYKLKAPAKQSVHTAPYQQDASTQSAIAAVARSIAKKQASLEAEQLHMERLISGEPDLDIWRVPTAPHLLRQLEKKQARLTGDDEERRALRTSTAIKAEDRSEDDEDEVNVELKTSTAHHNLFNPTRPKSTRKKGYVDCDFINDDDDDEPSNQGSNPEGSSDPDWTPDSSVTPSPPRKPKTPKPKEITMFSPSVPKGVTLTMEEYRTLMSMARTTAASRQQDPQEQHGTDQHGRKLHDDSSRLITRQDAPQHGTWNDVHYLMTTFNDQYEMYRRRCGKGANFESIWECYMPTQQENIIKHLNVTQPTRSVPWDRLALEGLTNEQLKGLLCSTLGINYQHETMAQLNLHKLEGSYLTSANWIVLQTKWEQVLMRCTPNGELLPKALTKHFIQSITDTYIRTWLFQQDKKHWKDAFEAIIAAIDDSLWLKGYLLASAEERAIKPPPKITSSGGGAAAPAPAGIVTKEKIKLAAVDSGDFNPLAFKNKSGKINVNPNLKKAMPNANPNKEECSTCGYVHNFDMCLCTSERKKTGEACLPLSKEEIVKRLFTRWNQGHFFATIPDQIKHLLVPTPASAAAAASITVAAISKK